MVAYEYQKQAAKVGFDWPDVAGVEDKIREELNEILTAASDDHKISEIGDLLFVMVNWLRWLGVDDPESLLRAVNLKFYRRFRYVEQQARAAGKDLPAMSLKTWTPCGMRPSASATDKIMRGNHETNCIDPAGVVCHCWCGAFTGGPACPHP